MTRRLDGRVYAAIREGAEEHGGIGFGPEYENDRPPYVQVNTALRGKPLTAYAIAVEALGGGEEIRKYVSRAFLRADLFSDEANSLAPQRIVERENIPWNRWPRFSFESWVKELEIVPVKTKSSEEV
jgi:hypothetical protein